MQVSSSLINEIEKSLALNERGILIGLLLDSGVVEVKVLQSHDNWFGVTYKEDKESVVNSIQELIRDGVYPQKLF